MNAQHPLFQVSSSHAKEPYTNKWAEGVIYEEATTRDPLNAKKFKKLYRSGQMDEGIRKTYDEAVAKQATGSMMRRLWYEKNKEKRQEKARLYYEKNKGTARLYYEKNKEKINGKMKEYREKNKDERAP